MAGRKDENGLTPKQLAFCRAYVETGNASEAYRRAFETKAMKTETIGRRAHDLFHQGKVKATIAALKAETDGAAVKELGLTREWIIKGLMSNAEAGAKTITLKDGGTAPVNLAASNQAYGLLGKVDTMGLFVDRAKVELAKTFDEMDDDELAAFIAKRTSTT